MTTGLEGFTISMISMHSDLSTSLLLEADGFLQDRLLGGCHDIGTPGSLLGDNGLGLSDGGGFDDWTWKLA